MTPPHNRIEFIISTWFGYYGACIFANACNPLANSIKIWANGSHGTIHTFKNYFTTVLSVFSFQFSVSATISSIQTDPLCSY